MIIVHLGDAWKHKENGGYLFQSVDPVDQTTAPIISLGVLLPKNDICNIGEVKVSQYINTWVANYFGCLIKQNIGIGLHAKGFAEYYR